TETQTITVEPPTPPTFQNVPGPLTLTCEDSEIFSFDSLFYTNNSSGLCLIEGWVQPTVDSSLYDICGGTITATWTYTDTCGNTITETQTITVEPPTPPTFPNVPGPLTLTCEDSEIFSFDSLFYTNNSSGLCLIEGWVQPTVDSSLYDICGGTITATWTYTDTCGNTITETQTITVERPTPPTFQNVPGPLTLTCEDSEIFSFDSLFYTNNSSGLCLIEGWVQPTVDSSLYDICGGTITATWTYTDTCGNTITETQTITVEPPTPPTFPNVPGPLTLTCEDSERMSTCLHSSPMKSSDPVFSEKKKQPTVDSSLYDI